MNLRKPLGLSSKGKFPPEYRYWTYSRQTVHVPALVGRCVQVGVKRMPVYTYPKNGPETYFLNIWRDEM